MTLKLVTHADGTQVHRHLGGWHRQTHDSRDFRIHLPFGHAANLPAHVDNRSLCSAIRDQGQLGSCTAFMLSGLVESREEVAGRKAFQAERTDWAAKVNVAISNVVVDSAGVVTYSTRVTPPSVPAPTPTPPAPTPGKLVQVSTLYQYYQSRVDEGTVSEDSGATIRGAVAASAKHGCVDEAVYPYIVSAFAKAPPPAVVAAATAHKVTSYHSVVDGDLASLKAMVAAGYLVGFGFDVYSNFMSQEMATKGFLSLPTAADSFEGGHAVCIVGYDEPTNAFLVRNSWGTGWGLAGYFWMDQKYFTTKDSQTGTYYAADCWVVEAAPVGF